MVKAPRHAWCMSASVRRAWRTHLSDSLPVWSSCMGCKVWCLNDLVAQVFVLGFVTYVSGHRASGKYFSEGCPLSDHDVLLEDTLQSFGANWEFPKIGDPNIVP